LKTHNVYAENATEVRALCHWGS